MIKEDLPFVGYHNLSSRTSKYFKRDGVEVEKGVVLTEPYLEKHLLVSNILHSSFFSYALFEPAFLVLVFFHMPSYVSFPSYFSL